MARQKPETLNILKTTSQSLTAVAYKPNILASERVEAINQGAIVFPSTRLSLL